MDTLEHAAPVQHHVDLPSLTRRTTALLEAGVPLTLLLDLVDEQGPRSQQLYRIEGGSADWVPTQR